MEFFRRLFLLDQAFNHFLQVMCGLFSQHNSPSLNASESLSYTLDIVLRLRQSTCPQPMVHFFMYNCDESLSASLLDSQPPNSGI
jgi:hypothetical protein